MTSSEVPMLPSGYRETITDGDVEVLVYYLGCLAQASYLIRDKKAKTAFIVDPRRDVDAYLQELQSKRTRLHGVFLTHVHADFVPGHVELSRRGDADIYYGPSVKARISKNCSELDMIEVEDNQVIPLSDRYIFRALHTPGHTPESITWLLEDRTDKDSPKELFAFTGDTLFIGSVGRPDLVGSIGHTADEMASLMYQSLWKKLMTLPDDVKIFPGHGAGSPCGKGLSDDLWSTIGHERRSNVFLQIKERDEFVSFLTSGQPTAPKYFLHCVGMNLPGAQPLNEVVCTAQWMPAKDCLPLNSDDAMVLDTRDSVDFAKCHLQGALNIPKGGSGGAVIASHEGNFAIWVGTLIPSTTKIYLVAYPGEEKEALIRLGRIGYRAEVVISDSPNHWKEAGLELAEHSQLNLEGPSAVHDLIGDQSHSVIDVRTPGEYDNNHLKTAINWPLNKMSEFVREADRTRTYFCYCVSGFRSSIAASYLEMKGLDVVDVTGGFATINVKTPELTVTGKVCPNMQKTAEALQKHINKLH